MRVLLVDLGAYFGNDFVDSAFTGALELDGEISAVGFGDPGKAELKAGAAGVAFHFRNRQDNFFHAEEDVVGIGQRRARGREVVEDEIAFVHGGEQIAAERVIAKKRRADEHQATDGEHERMGKSETQGAGVLANPRHGFVVVRSRTTLWLAAQKVAAEGGGPRQRQQKGREKRRRHGKGEGAEKSSGNSRDGD